MIINPTTEQIESFLNGYDDEKYITSIEYDYSTNKVYKIIHQPNSEIKILSDTFTPFCWVGNLSEKNFYGNNRSRLTKAMNKYGIVSEKLETGGNERLENGLNIIIKSTKSYSHLVNFLKGGGIDPWERENSNNVMIFSPVEQYMIQKNKRLYKGFEEYNDIHRLVFDIETTGLDPNEHTIFMIGLKDNRDFKHLLFAENEEDEKKMIIDFFGIIDMLRPTSIGGYNSAFFDFPFIIRRAELLGLDIDVICKTLSNDKPIKSKEATLKLGNEMESYTQHMMWGYNIVDIAHAVRRAQAINSDIKKWGLKYITKFIGKEKPNRIYVKGDEIYKIYKENKDYYYNEKTGGYKAVGTPGTENLMKRFPNVYKIVNGEFIIENYLNDDLIETMDVDNEFNQATFLLSKLAPTTYERISTMGTATLWKLIMASWSFNNNLAIPRKLEKRNFTGGLSKVIKTGYSERVLKLDYSSLYPSIQLVHGIFPECDITNALKMFLKYFRDTRIHYKKLASQFEDVDKQKSENYSRKQLPIKIFINGFFGSLSAPHVFPWGDIDKGEQITCTGRQYLRQLIMWFMNRGYTPLVMDTDGVNFSTPTEREGYKYIGKGLNELVIKGKEYVGAAADVAEYNDLFMIGEMGLDIDGVWPSTINISRKNYLLLTPSGKIKLTGNSVKSKGMPQYCEEFIKNSAEMLLKGDGPSFIEYYYDYLGKIFNKEIPLAKIANKSRVKQSVESYKKHVKKTDKGGRLMPRQAHMELVIKNNISVNTGDTIYYVNNGKRKSHGDVQKKNIWDATTKEKNEYIANNGKPMPPDRVEININAYIINSDDLENNPNMLGEYNVPRYISTFNNKVKPLLTVFDYSIRDLILVEDPKDRGFFTKKQLELVNGQPMEERFQDDLDEVLRLYDSEVSFWSQNKISPFYMYNENNIKLVEKEYVDYNKELVSS